MRVRDGGALRAAVIRGLVSCFLLTSPALAPVAQAAEDHGAEIDSLSSLRTRGDLAGMEQGARSLLARLETARGSDSLEIVATLQVLVSALLSSGKATEPETRRLAERSKAMAERALGPDHPTFGASLHALALVMERSGDEAGARPLLERALAIHDKSPAPNDSELAAILHDLAANLTGTSGDSLSQRLYERSLAIRRTVLAPDAPDLAATMASLASLLAARADFAGARPLFEAAVEIMEKQPKPDPNLPAALSGLGGALSNLSEGALAQLAFERALALAEQRPIAEDLILADILYGFGAHVWRAGDYVKARKLFERGQAIREKLLPPGDAGLALGYSSIGAVTWMMYDYSAALEAYRKALEIYEKAAGPEHFIVAIVLGNIGGVQLQTGDLTAARPNLERALAINEKVFGPRSTRAALNLTNLARIKLRLGDVAGARALHERAVKILEEKMGAKHPEVAFVLGRLANLHAFSGDDSTARPLFEQAIQIVESSHGRDHPQLSWYRDELARAAARQGALTTAADGAVEALRIARDNLQANGTTFSEREALRQAGTARWGMDLCMTLAARGVDGETRRSLFDALIRSRAVVLDVMAERHRFISSSTDPRILTLSSDLTRARGRLADLVVRGIGSLKPEAYRALVDEASAARERAERALADASEGFSKQLAQKRVGLEEVAEGLPEGSALVAVAQYLRLDLSLNVRRNAATDSAAKSRPIAPRPDGGQVSTGRSGGVDHRSYLAFVLRAGERAPQVVDLGTAHVIDSLVARWQDDASGHWLRAGVRPDRAEARYRTTGADLRRSVWDRLAPAILGAKTVFVVPDGSLNFLNLAALPADEGGYLVEHGPLLHHLSAERDLVRGHRTSRPGDLLALGAPDYDATSVFAALATPGTLVASALPEPVTGTAASGAYRGLLSGCSEFATARFDPLRATAEELRAIVQLWQRNHRSGSASRVIERSDRGASESEFKRVAPGCRVLHLATHGFFLGGACESAWKPARGIGRPSSATDPGQQVVAGVVDAPPPVTGENPLLLSGLVLAGANHRSAASAGEDDGILTAEEVASLDLAGVEWAVLSACETGVGDVRAGEGVFGLRRAFQLAGVGTLIMSLWSVDDEATRTWMKALYEGRLKRNLETAAAVRHASVEMLRERRAKKQSTHPFYWGAFVAAGDWR